MLAVGTTDAGLDSAVGLAVAFAVMLTVRAAALLVSATALTNFNAVALAVFLETTELVKIGGTFERDGRLKPDAEHSSQNQSPSGITYS